MTRSIYVKCWTLFAVVTIIAAVLLSVARLLLPYASLYQQDIEKWVGQTLGQPVKIGSLAADWHGLGPQLKLLDIDFLDRESGKVQASLKQASIAVDVIASLFNAELRLGSLTVAGVNLSVVRHHDGRITVTGFGKRDEANNRSPDTSTAMLDWLFSQERLVLEDAAIYWYDEGLSKKGLQFVNVNIELRNDGDRHQFDGSASLPEDLGRRLSFAVDLRGDVFVADSWSGSAYLNGAGLQMAALLNWLPLRGVHIDKGVAELRLWSKWKDSRLQALEGELSVFGLNLSRQTDKDDVVTHASEYLDALSGRFSWQRKDAGWRLDIERLMVGRRGNFWPPGNYHLEWVSAANINADAGFVKEKNRKTFLMEGSGSLKLQADFIRLEDILALLLLTDIPADDFRDTVMALQPTGEFENLSIHWQPGVENIWHINSDFTALSLLSRQKIPGFSGLSGHLTATETQGQLTLKTQQMGFDAPSLFRHPMSIKRLEGDWQWWKEADDWHVSGRELVVGNKDILLSANVDVILPVAGKSPYLDLVVGFETHPGALLHMEHYLPVGIMSQSLVAWLEGALVDGKVSNGAVLFHGPMRKFPFIRNDGRFEARLVVEDGELDYVPGWPRVKGLTTEILFHGRQMVVNAVQGQMLNAELKFVHVGIDNMMAESLMLELSGEVAGNTREVLRFLQLSPLKKRFGQLVDGVQADGQSLVTLELQVPFAAEEDVTVKGAVQLQDSAFLLADGAVNISRLNGRLEFSADGLFARAVKGRVMGLEAQFSVVTATEEEGGTTTVSAFGNASIEEIRTIVDPPLFDRFSGRIDWQAQMRVPGEDGAGASLLVSSDLLGLATHLPPPVSKPADQTLATVIEIHLPVELDRPLKIQVGDDLNVILDLGDALEMQRGEIRFADGPAELPPQAGMRVAGIIPTFSFSEWLPLFESMEELAEEDSNEGINRVTMTVADVELYRDHYYHARVDAVLERNAWQTKVDSDQAKGSLQVPMEDDIPLIMNFKYLHLKRLEGDGDEVFVDPRELPPMRIQIQSFKYDDIDYGSLAMTASRSPAGLRLTDLQMQSSLMSIQAHGDWQMVKGEHFSSFNINFSSPNVGKALSLFDYNDTIKGGKGSFAINARWPGDPFSFALARLDGNINLAISNGYLLEVEPGLGRVFGLLSLQTLPRRLLLDFRDVFNKGFAFDHIKGDFDVSDGQALTTNLNMKGPSASIAVEGRIGLAARDYDQRVTVIPDVAGTVPLLTAILQGPVVGGVVYMVKKLLKPTIDKAAMIRYSVTGSWDDPVIERITDK